MGKGSLQKYHLRNLMVNGYETFVTSHKGSEERRNNFKCHIGEEGGLKSAGKRVTYYLNGP
jgi:hypothetical protein